MRFRILNPTQCHLSRAYIHINVAWQVVIKFAHYAPQPQPFNIAFRGSWSQELRLSSAVVLTAASPAAENTLNAPERVVPEQLQPEPMWEQSEHPQLRFIMPAWSVGALVLAHSAFSGSPLATETPAL